MTYNPDTEFVQFARALADAAGEVMRRHFKAPVSVEYKADSSPVTQADRDIETAMVALIEKRYPDHGIFGEEHGRKNETSPYQWVLDPIDGTKSFIAGFPMFTTLIALVKDNVPVIGVIDQAISGERWVGVSGQKIIIFSPRLRGELEGGGDIASPTAQLRVLQSKTQASLPPPQAGEGKKLTNAMLATTSMDYFTPEEMKSFAALKKQCRYALLAGDAYAYAMLASGRIDIVVDSGLKPYDFCALRPVIESAGGVFTDWEGQPVTLKSKGRVIAAANKELHREALKIITSSPLHAGI